MPNPLRLNTASIAILCTLLVLSSRQAVSDDTALTAAQISELISSAPEQAGSNNNQLNWQQWGEAEASAQSVVDAPVPDWGFLPDALPEDYASLSALSDSDAQTLLNWQVFGVTGEVYRVKRLTLGRRQEGGASWYGPGFNGRKTASGEIFNMHALTAAHRTLPLPSYLAYKIANYPEPLYTLENRQWGALKTRSNAILAAEGRIEISTEYLIDSWPIHTYGLAT